MLVGTARKSPESKRIYAGKRFYSAWLSWWDFTHVLGTGYFPFLVGHWKDSEVFRENKWIQRDIYSERMKVFRKHPLRAVPEEDFLHKKINTRDIFVVYASTVQKNDVFNLWRSDTIELDVGDQHFRNQVLENIIFFGQARRLFLTCLFCFLLGFGGIQGLVLVFPPISQLLQATWSGLI